MSKTPSKVSALRIYNVFEECSSCMKNVSYSFISFISFILTIILVAMDTQEIHVPENSDCITLGLQSSICIGCTYLKNDRKLKPKKKRTQKQTCAKQWEKKNLSHRSLQKATHCQQSRIELQELGYGSVGNLCNKPAGPSYGTPAFTRRRATKRFIDALTPRVSTF